MAFNGQTEVFIRDFVNDLSEDNVAIFAGAGLSRSAGYVDWRGLLEDIAKELELDIFVEHDLIALAQYHVNLVGSTAGIKRKILEEFSHHAESSRAHKLLAELPISTYWTTNYDTLLEDSLRIAFKVADVKHQISQLSNTRPNRDAVVYKMHGDVHNPENAVLTKSQYERYYRSHGQFITALSGHLISKTFLFIGFSFNDPNLDYVLSRLSHEPGERQHYCFMKEEAKVPGEENSAYEYRKRKLELKIADLKRYRIKAILVKEYSEIDDILQEISYRYRKKTIFISGSAEVYGKWERVEAQQFIHQLSKSLVGAELRIVNGFGWGVGSAVINGALEAIWQRPDRHSEDQLVIRPFPQFETNGKELRQLWEEYRQRMIPMAGIAIFLFGNKLDGGEIVVAGGVIREFQIAMQHNLIPLPIGLSGYAAQEIFLEIEKNPSAFYGEHDWIFPIVKELATATSSYEDISKKIIQIINQLNR